MKSDYAKEFIAQSRAFLAEDYLPKIERCIGALTDEDVWWRPDEGSNSIGNLMLHLEGSTRNWIADVAGGENHPRNRQQEFDERRKIPRSELMDRMRKMLAEADAVLARLNPEVLLERRQSRMDEVNVMWAIYHAVEHFSMHTGQIIMLAKMRTGGKVQVSD